MKFVRTKAKHDQTSNMLQSYQTSENKKKTTQGLKLCTQQTKLELIKTIEQNTNVS